MEQQKGRHDGSPSAGSRALAGSVLRRMERYSHNAYYVEVANPILQHSNTLTGFKQQQVSPAQARCMSSHSDRGEYLTATIESGMLIIHSLPVTLSWVPRDVVNDAYNVAGTVTVGTFDSLDDAKRAAGEQYPVLAGDWKVSEVLPLDVEPNPN